MCGHADNFAAYAQIASMHGATGSIQDRRSLCRVPGYEVLGNGDSWMTGLRNDNVLTYVANLAWTRGGHNIRFRVDINNTQMNDYQPQRGQGARGGFEFAGGVTGLNAAGAPATNQFNSYAAFLLGLPSVYGTSFQVLDPITVREWQHGLYFRDQWQATRNLTVTLGLRWEYYPIIGRGGNRGIERYTEFAGLLKCGVFVAFIASARN